MRRGLGLVYRDEWQIWVDFFTVLHAYDIIQVYLFLLRIII